MKIATPYSTKELLNLTVFRYSLLLIISTFLLEISAGIILATASCVAWLLFTNYVDNEQSETPVFHLWSAVVIASIYIVLSAVINPNNYVVSTIASSMWLINFVWLERFVAEGRLRMSMANAASLRAPVTGLVRRITLNTIFIDLLLWKGDMFIEAEWITLNNVNGILYAFVTILLIMILVPYHSRDVS